MLDSAPPPPPKHWRDTAWIAPLVAGLAIALQWTGQLQTLEWQAWDLMVRLRPAEAKDPRLTMVTIDEADLTRAGQWPISDAVLAQAVRVLHTAQPQSIGLALYRDLPLPPGSDTWKVVMVQTPNLIGIEQLIEPVVSPPPILAEQAQVGFADVVLDEDGKLRRGLLAMSAPDGKVRWSLGAMLAAQYLRSQGQTLQFAHSPLRVQVGEQDIPAMQPSTGSYVNVDAQGLQVLLNFRGTATIFETLSLTQVLAQEFDPEHVRDRIVIIGSVAPSFGAKFSTAYSSRDRMPGFIVHANIASQLLATALDGRPVWRVLPDGWEWFWILGWAAVGTGLTTLTFRQPTMRNGVLAVGGLLVAQGSLWALAYGGALLAIWLPMVTPSLTLFGAVVTSMMALLWQNLRRSYRQLAQYSQDLERQVSERTAQLAQAKEAAETASQAKSHFLANMSHELRSPLNAVLGFAQVLTRSPHLSTTDQENIQIIRHSGEHLLGLINSILDLSKIEAGKMALEPEALNLQQLVNEIMATYQLPAQQKGLELRLDYGTDLPDSLEMDGLKLRQVLINLISNAVKFTQMGYVSLRIRQQGQWLEFAVQDTGVGIVPEDRDRLFQAFEQAKVGRRAGPGTGLGLAISQKFVSLMGGELKVESCVGQGSLFTVVLPLVVSNAPPPVSLTTQTILRFEPSPQGRRILVVDDQPSNRRLLCQMLAHWGFELREASDGHDALAQWQAWQPELIWMDMRMPGMDGYEATQRIKAQAPNLPIIAVTASALEEEKAAVLALGCDDFVRKPFEEQTILQQVAQHLQLHCIYANESFVAPASASEINAGDITVMSSDWRSQLADAALDGSKAELLALIAQIPAEHESLAAHLRQLTQNFAFEQIYQLVASDAP
ncbi:MAG: CHASE2 domain-containing protein [Spirulina sp. SIO3F2]|nr:CHASE2 domain-containing protein [Spirulina sp. SIO3F2]